MNSNGRYQNRCDVPIWWNGFVPNRTADEENWWKKSCCRENEMAFGILIRMVYCHVLCAIRALPLCGLFIRIYTSKFMALFLLSCRGKCIRQSRNSIDLTGNKSEKRIPQWWSCTRAHRHSQQNQLTKTVFLNSFYRKKNPARYSCVHVFLGLLVIVFGLFALIAGNW